MRQGIIPRTPDGKVDVNKINEATRDKIARLSVEHIFSDEDARMAGQAVREIVSDNEHRDRFKAAAFVIEQKVGQAERRADEERQGVPSRITINFASIDRSSIPTVEEWAKLADKSGKGVSSSKKGNAEDDE